MIPTREILINPANPCPSEVVREVSWVSLAFFGFDGRFHDGTIEMHADLIDDVVKFFHLAYSLRFPIERLQVASDFGWNDDAMMAANNTSGFNYRTIAGSDELSQHSFGRAFDVNPRQNPYIRYPNGHRIIQPPTAEWNPSAAGALHQDHPLVQLMLERDWTWGGDWTRSSGRIDYQHFEKPA